MRKRTRTRDTREAQALTARTSGDVLATTPIYHGELLDLAEGDDHPQYLPVDGSRDMAGSVVPSLPDTYDLGSSTKMWRKIYASEMEAVLLAKNTVTLLGGWLLVSKNEGTLAAQVDPLDTTVDFGQAMTNGHFVLLRGVGMVEYLQVGALVSGTTYNVTRNLDGSGANTWLAGTPYAVLGANGDGRIELNAYDTPRISIIRQGSAYNSQTEVVRIGDLNGAFGISTERYGFGVGDYSAGNYLRYDPTGGFVVKGGAGKVAFDADGIGLLASASNWPQPGTADGAKIMFTEGGDVITTLSEYYENGAHGEIHEFNLLTAMPSTTGFDRKTINLGVTNSAETSYAKISAGRYVYPSGRNIIELTAVHGGSAKSLSLRDDGIFASEMRVFGNYYKDVGGTFVAGSIFVPLTTPLTSTAWDGDARSTTARTLIDLSAVFGAPAGIKAVLVRTTIRDSGSAGTDCNFSLAPGGGSTALAYATRCSGLANDSYASAQGVVPCDANGDVYYQITASGTGTMDVTMEIWGYWI